MTASDVRFLSCRELRYLCITQQNLRSAYLRCQGIPTLTLVRLPAIPGTSRRPFLVVVVWHGSPYHSVLSSVNTLRWHIVCRFISLVSYEYSLIIYALIHILRRLSCTGFLPLMSPIR